MPTYQGLVASVTGENRAEILITPGKQSIPGAPEVSKKVCHACTDGSTVRIEAVNRAGAEVGDWVSLTRPSGTVKKNTTALLGLPLLGAIIGAGAGLVLMVGLRVSAPSLALCALLGLLSGLTVGIRLYRRLSEQNQLVVSRIIKKRTELPTLREDKQGIARKDDTACDLCSGCVVR